MNKHAEMAKLPRLALALRALAPLVGVMLLTFTSSEDIAYWIGVGMAAPAGFLVVGERVAVRQGWRLTLPRLGTWIGLAVIAYGGLIQSAPLVMSAIGGIGTCKVWLITDLMR